MEDRKKQTILYFGNDWRSDNRTSSHHIASRLIRDHFVIYIESPGLRAPQGSKRDIKKLIAKVTSIYKGARQIENGAYIYTLFQIPFHNYTIVGWVNKKLIVWQLRKLCRKLRIKNPILWFLLPHITPAIESLDEKLSVYYCVDDYAELPGVDKARVESMDAEMSQKCDLVFVTAEPLLKKKNIYGDKVHLSRHGVDFEHFNSVEKKKNTIPRDMEFLENVPVIGFFGLIEKWIDLDMIKYLAIERPNWHFLMIGRVAIEENPCEGLSNVHFIGSKTYEELPSYAQVFDVSLIPCKNNELIRNFNPLKLREYLAMGTPVVTNYFPEIEDFKDVVSIASTKEEFLDKIERELNENTSEKIKTRVDKVIPLSWESRYDYVMNIVKEKIKRKSQLPKTAVEEGIDGRE